MDLQGKLQIKRVCRKKCKSDWNIYVKVQNNNKIDIYEDLRKRVDT